MLFHAFRDKEINGFGFRQDDDETVMSLETNFGNDTPVDVIWQALFETLDMFYTVKSGDTLQAYSDGRHFVTFLLFDDGWALTWHIEGLANEQA